MYSYVLLMRDIGLLMLSTLQAYFLNIRMFIQ